MPIKGGKSRKTISSNVKELVDEWKEDGAIGTSHPPDKKAAVKQAVAISLKKAGVSRSQPGAAKNAKKAPAKKAPAKKGAAKKAASRSK
jgi:hypothetical protein